MFEDDDSVFAALRAGARGYVLKDADEEELPARSGPSPRRGDLQPRGRRPGARLLRPAAARAAKAFPELTDREREILALIAPRARDNPSIARRARAEPQDGGQLRVGVLPSCRSPTGPRRCSRADADRR